MSVLKIEFLNQYQIGILLLSIHENVCREILQTKQIQYLTTTMDV